MTTEKQRLEAELNALQQIAIQAYQEELERVSKEAKNIDWSKYQTPKEPA